MKKVRTRYAPSPTGYLHIGGARTALFSYLFAKKYQGDFIVRIEDTDIARNVEDGERSQLDNLNWLGIFPDESPLNPVEKYGKYRQSEKLERYNKIIKSLIQSGKAYIAYDNPEEILAQKTEQEKNGIASFRYKKNWLQISEEEKQNRYKNNQYSIRLAMTANKEYSWNDLVRGKISVNSNDVGDWVIQKADGYPTYNFAVVIDDYDMQITHVLRGEEHITNTPKQLAVYDALGWNAPDFGHLTIITNMEGQKLSKRDFSVRQFIEDYKNQGYLPEAIINFLALLGWTSADAKEIMSKEELIENFDYNRLSKSPSKFDIKKMEWFSKQYFKNMDNGKIIKIINNSKFSYEWMNIFVETYKQNAITFQDLKNALEIYSNPKNSLEQKIENINIVEIFKQQLNKKTFDIDSIQEAINKTKEITGANGKNLFLPIRLATTFEEHGPELAKAIFLFGEELINKRLSGFQV